MKLKLDENLPESLVSDLSEMGHDVDNVRGEALTGRNDDEVWRAAQRSGRILITQIWTFQTFANLLQERIADWCRCDCGRRGGWRCRAASGKCLPASRPPLGSATLFSLRN